MNHTNGDLGSPLKLPPKPFVKVASIPDEIERLQKECERHAWLFFFTQKRMKELEARQHDAF